MFDSNSGLILAMLICLICFTCNEVSCMQILLCVALSSTLTSCSNCPGATAMPGF